ncbi:cation:proton antiporter [Citricoccus sp. SGAir0253]|uniref:cation:proton antiporter n=1 Tax=Citricoccus sp. SGAir0253 TaxID=2567881 RepID=UPI0010CD4780|nr:cation:proton antiporter [Citricoccus sp. SGAir0253]QCU77273.1 cation:proton antiporter [Citricoccus sp. SGAir0253]
MTTTALALVELGAILLLLGVLGRFAARIGMSPVPLYLLGGLGIGYGGILFGRDMNPLTADAEAVPFQDIGEFTHLASEIGVVLLLLMLGLEYSARELVTGLRGSWRDGLLDLVLNATPGVLAGLLLGWGATGAVVLGGITYISSSGIIAKVLGDLGRLGNRETPVILSILVFEDLAMALYLPLMTAFLGGVSLAAGAQAVGIALTVVTVVLLLALRFGPQISRFVASPEQETFLLKVLGLALLVAGVAGALQVSAGVGAFLLGIAISGATAHSARDLLEPLRDLFAALFFVLFGMNTDPRTLPPVLGWALLLALATALTKVLTGYLAARSAGIGVAGRWRAGAALTIRGEFSIVIAGLAVASGAMAADVSALATAYVMTLAIAGPVLTRYADGLGRAAARRRARAPQARPAS